MLRMNQVPFPAFALFQMVERPDGKGKQPQFHKKIHDGRTLVVVPDLRSLTPITDIRIPVIPGRVIFEGPKFVIVTCFVPERFSLAHQVKKGLFAGAAKVSETKRTKKPKPTKSVTGHFIGEAAPVKTSALNGPNVIGHVTPEMAAALRRQRQLAGLEVPKRGVAVHIVNGHKKRAGKKG